LSIIATFLQVLEIVAPVFILAGLGFVWVKAGWEYPVQFVTRLTMTVSIPCLIFVALVRMQIDPTILRNTALAAFSTYLLLFIFFAGFLRITGFDQRTFLPPLVFGNTGNLGLPLAFFAFGSAGFDFAVIIFAVMALISFTFGVWIVSGGRSPIVAIKEPLVWATILGAVFLFTGNTLPDWSMNTLELIGQMGIPLMLLTLGVAITRLQPAALSRAVWMSLLKIIICIGAPVGAGIWFELPPFAFAVLVLQVATPVAVSNFMLAEKYGANSAEVAGLVVVSTLFSVIAIPLILAFLI